MHLAHAELHKEQTTHDHARSSIARINYEPQPDISTTPGSITVLARNMPRPMVLHRCICTPTSCMVVGQL